MSSTGKVRKCQYINKQVRVVQCAHATGGTEKIPNRRKKKKKSVTSPRERKEEGDARRKGENRKYFESERGGEEQLRLHTSCRRHYSFSEESNCEEAASRRWSNAEDASSYKQLLLFFRDIQHPLEHKKKTISLILSIHTKVRTPLLYIRRDLQLHLRSSERERESKKKTTKFVYTRYRQEYLFTTCCAWRWGPSTAKTQRRIYAKHKENNCWLDVYAETRTGNACFTGREGWSTSVYTERE